MPSFQNYIFGYTIPFCFVCLMLLPIASCVSNLRREPLPYNKPPEEVKRNFEILDYQNRTDGENLAEWVTAYMNGGIQALERMNEFAPYYVFVVEQSSPDLNTLILWRDNFRAEQDFPQLVFLRVYRRLTENLSINPDETYGAFFETLMKRIPAIRWPQAQRYADTWVLAHYSLPEPAAPEPSEPLPQDFDEQPETPDDSRLYTYLIMVVIEKAEVETVLNALIDETSIDIPLQRDQAQAVSALKSNFFRTF